MLYLALSILSSAAVVHLLKMATRRTSARFAVFAANYLAAGLLGLLVSGRDIANYRPPAAWALAIVLGCLYVAGFFVLSRTITRSGTAVAASVSRISVVIPVAASVFFFAEQISGWQIAAVAIAVVTLPFAAPDPPWATRHAAGGRHQLPSGLDCSWAPRISARSISSQARSSGWPVFASIRSTAWGSSLLRR